MARLLKIYDGTTWVELAKKSDIPSLSGYATQQWVQSQNYLTGINSTMIVNALGYTPIATDNNTWRPINVNSSSAINDTSTTVNFVGGGATSVSYSNGTITISSTDNNTWRPLGTGSNDACAGNDARLSDARQANGGNSDTVDGYHASESATGGTLVARTSNGYVYATYYNCSNGAENPSSFSNNTFLFADGSGWIRKASASDFRAAIGAGTSSFTGYSSSDKLNGSFINNTQNWTSNAGTVTSVSAGTGLSISGTASVSPTINIDSGYKLPNTTEWNNKQAKLVSGSNIKTINGESILGAGNISISGSGGWSTELYMHTINFQINMGGAYFGAASITYVCEADSIFFELYDVAYYMSYTGPNYDDDLPYVGLIPASGFLYGGGHRYTVYGACYKYKNGNHYIRLAAVNENGSVEYFDTNDDTFMGNSVMTDYMIRIN